MALHLHKHRSTPRFKAAPWSPPQPQIHLGKATQGFPQSRPWRTYTSDSVVPVNEGLPENQPPGHHQVLKAKDKGTKKPGTKPEAAAILHVAPVPTSWGKRAPGSPLSCSQPLRAVVKAVNCCSAFHGESDSRNTQEALTLQLVMPPPVMPKFIYSKGASPWEGSSGSLQAAVTRVGLHSAAPNPTLCYCCLEPICTLASVSLWQLCRQLS